MTKNQIYKSLIPQITALLQMETDAIANMANVSSALFNGLPDLNWAGFYILRGNELVLGPFQGKPACVRIKMGRGVCGTCAQTGQTQRVADVHKFPGHIACDSASKSEIVIPIFKNKQVWGVLDIDSPIENRFDAEDQQYLENVVREFEKHSFI